MRFYMGRQGTTAAAAWISVALVVTSAWAVPLTAGRASAQAPPSFAAQAELVTVDVVVLGPDGKPVPGLTRDDFVVKEDGRPQTLTAFEAVEALVPALASPQTVASSPSQARVATNVAGPPTRRTFAIVFDDLHIGDINVEQAKRAVADLRRAADARPATGWCSLTRLGRAASGPTTGRRGRQPGARRSRACARTRRCGGPAWSASRRTTRRCRSTCWATATVADLRAAPRRGAVGSLRADGAAVRMQLGAAGIQGRRSPAVRQPRTAGCRLRRAPRAAAVGAEVYSRVPRAARRDAAHRPADHPAARRAPGRKALVLVTEGFPIDTSLDVFREVREQAARANVVIHFLDARGLATGPDFLSAAGPTGAIPAAGHRSDASRCGGSRTAAREGARRGDGRPRAADERPRLGADEGGRRIARHVPARLRADEREARRPLPQAQGRGPAAGPAGPRA